jgi:hypothetical protein
MEVVFHCSIKLHVGSSVYFSLFFFKIFFIDLERLQIHYNNVIVNINYALLTFCM